MSSQLNSKLTPEEYLEFERRSEERHEYVDGELIAMSGASRRHNQIVVNLRTLSSSHPSAAGSRWLKFMTR